MVVRRRNTWSRHGDQRPLGERWKETAGKLNKLGGMVGGPICETKLDEMEREIKRLTPAPKYGIPIIAEAGREFSNTVRRFCEIHGDLLKSQKKIDSKSARDRRASNSRRHYR